MASVSSLLAAFKMKIEESVTLVPNMSAEEKLKAVQFWNVVSEKLQEIVNNSAADISALAYEMEKQQDDKKCVISDVLQQSSDGSPMVHDTTSLQETQALEALTGDPPRLPFRLDLMSAVESSVSAEAINEHTSLIPSTATTILASEATPSLSYVSSTGAPLVVSSSSSNVTGHQNALLMLAPAMPIIQDGVNMIDVTRSSRLQELLSRPVTTSSPPKSHSPANNNKKVDNLSKGSGVTSGAAKSPTKAMSIRKRLTKTAVKGKTFVPDPVSQDNFIVSCAALADGLPRDDQDAIDENSMLKNIKIESVVAMNHDNAHSQQRFEVSRSPTVKNSVLISEKELKPVELDVEDDEEEEEEEEDDEGLYGEVEGVVEADPVVDQNGKKIYTCTYCQKTYANASAYKAHKYSHTKPYGCTECHARFTTRGNLIVHTRRHTGEKPYGCPQCKAKFSTKGNLKRHIRSHSGARPWECLQCGGRFTEKKSLTVHMRRHTGERPYQCNVCGKQFAQTGILQTHMSMHMDQREHLCEHCGKSFRQKSQLRLHMMRHQGVRKYNCDQCDSKFLTKGDLERHHRTHTGERPFVCEMCGKTFTRQQSLNEHMNRHYGLKPYECKYCGKRFAEMSACYKHIKHHERVAKKNGTQLPTLSTTKRASMLSGASSGASPTSQQFTLGDDDDDDDDDDEEDDGGRGGGGVTGNGGNDDSSSEKFPVLLQAEVALDVGSEISVVQHDNSVSVLSDEHAVAVGGADSDFTAIKLLANASTSFEQVI